MNNYASYTHVNPAIMLGKPVVKGRRVTVELIIEKLATGETIESMIENYPSPSRTTILAALQFAADPLSKLWLSNRQKEEPEQI